MSVRGVPVQDLLENQDASVLYMVNEVTREVTALAVPEPEVVEEEKPRRRKKVAEPSVEEVKDEPAEGEGE